MMEMRCTSALLAIGVVLVACADPPAAAPHELPEEVSKFVLDRDLCDHLRGEIPEPGPRRSDSPTIDDINRACAGTDDRLARLRAKYANDPRAVTALASYEWPLEAESRERSAEQP